MNLDLWDRGDYAAFGKMVKDLREGAQPKGMSQRSLAQTIVLGIGRDVMEDPYLLTLANADPETFEERIREIQQLAPMLVNAKYGGMVQEAFDLDPELPGLLALAYLTFTGTRTYPGAFTSASGRASFKKLVDRWRNRVANIESGRRTDRRAVEAVLDALTWNDTAVNRPGKLQPIAIEPLSIPLLGDVPSRKTASELDAFFAESSAPRIDVRPAWAMAKPDFAVRVMSDDYEPYFFRGEILGIQQTFVFAEKRVALWHGVTDISLFAATSAPNAIGFEFISLQTGEQWEPNLGWTILGYVVARELVMPQGLRYQASHNLR